MSTQPKYTPVICIGVGLSGICLGAQLKVKYGIDYTGVHFYDRNAGYSGTWWVNRYPGAACDIPAIFYSFSFAPDLISSRIMATHSELRHYVDGVVNKYRLLPLMTLRTECESASWDSSRQRWSVRLRDLETGERYVHECKVLISAVGMLSVPSEPKIPGRETFEGQIVHTGRWTEDVELEGKDTIVVGNGCSGSQVVPNIVSHTKSVTQFIHSPHWLLSFLNPSLGSIGNGAIRYIPLIGRLFRYAVFLYAENMWRLFVMNRGGERFRRALEKQSKEYVQRVAPKKYQDMLIPEWEIACKRRIFDANEQYLNSLHAPNFELVKDDIVEILPRAVRTITKTYPADVIILATGFQSHNFLNNLKIHGKNGGLLNDHWKQMGGPGAYHTTAVHGFPNFFLLYGPNSNTGHTSVVMTTENTVNFVLKVIAPVLDGEASEVEVKADAEKEYVSLVQAVSKTRVISRCNNWYVSKDGWNSTSYPWSQVHYWWRSVFPVWNDWEYRYMPRHLYRQERARVTLTVLGGTALCLVGMLAVADFWDGRSRLRLGLEHVRQWWKSFNV